MCVHVQVCVLSLATSTVIDGTSNSLPLDLSFLSRLTVISCSFFNEILPLVSSLPLSLLCDSSSPWMYPSLSLYFSLPPSLHFPLFHRLSSAASDRSEAPDSCIFPAGSYQRHWPYEEQWLCTISLLLLHFHVFICPKCKFRLSRSELLGGLFSGNIDIWQRKQVCM